MTTVLTAEKKFNDSLVVVKTTIQAVILPVLRTVVVFCERYPENHDHEGHACKLCSKLW